MFARSGFAHDSRTPISSLPPEALGCGKDFAAGTGAGAIFLPHTPIPADRDDSGVAPFEDRGVAPPGVEGAVAGHVPSCSSSRF